MDVVRHVHNDNKYNLRQNYIRTERFTDLYMLNLLMVLGSNQFTLLPQLPLKMMHNLNVVKIYLKIIISLR
jgi:hypothetical protein